MIGAAVHIPLWIGVPVFVAVLVASLIENIRAVLDEERRRDDA